MKINPITGAVAGLAGAVAVLLVLVMLVRTWGLAEAVREGQQANTRTLDLIESCTTVGGECYDRGQEQTADVIELLNTYQRRVVTLAAACADRPDTQSAREIERCVNKALAQG